MYANPIRGPFTCVVGLGTLGVIMCVLLLLLLPLLFVGLKLLLCPFPLPFPLCVLFWFRGLAGQAQLK